MENLYIYSAKEDREKAKTLLLSLNNEGYNAVLGSSSPKQEDFVLLILSEDTDKESLLSCCPFLKEQFDLSSYHGFRLMPVLFFSSKKGLEKTWESGVGDIYDELISGEFKPFGYDEDDKSPLREFPRILEEYSE
ncbi:MAG: hypothetical protein K6B65_05350 [Bacilli bacterium]|nr:hypothetical protein [Bacilli bacterium]